MSITLRKLIDERDEALAMAYDCLEFADDLQVKIDRRMRSASRERLKKKNDRRSKKNKR